MFNDDTSLIFNGDTPFIFNNDATLMFNDVTTLMVNKDTTSTLLSFFFFIIPEKGSNLKLPRIEGIFPRQQS